MIMTMTMMVEMMVVMTLLLSMMVPTMIVMTFCDNDEGSNDYTEFVNL